MSRTCRRCGAPVPTGASFFCNRCGAQLPAEEPDLPVCRRCGKKQSATQSRFCDRCGTPLTPPVQPPSRVTPSDQTEVCPRCGFENRGNSLFYCKKCGSALENIKPPGTVTGQRTQERPARIAADGRAGPPQTPVTRSRVDRATAPVHPYVAAQPKRARSYRKAVIGIMVVILLLAVIAGIFIFMNPAGTPSGTSDNSTDPGLLGSLSPILPEKTVTATGPTLPVTQKKTVTGNQGTAVFSDTPPA